MLKRIRQPVLVAAAVGLFLVTGQPAEASTRTPQETRFHRAVVTCEQRTASASLRSCVRDLTTPDRAEPASIDLWHIFLDCLWFADEAMLDAMYPPTEEDYEDAVNACLGL